MTTQTAAKVVPATRMRLTTALGADFWNDSCALNELAEAVAGGATGATSNPVIVFSAIKADPKTWMPVLDRLIEEHEEVTEEDLAWKWIEAIGRRPGHGAAPPLRRPDGGAPGRPAPARVDPGRDVGGPGAPPLGGHRGLQEGPGRFPRAGVPGDPPRRGLSASHALVGAHRAGG